MPSLICEGGMSFEMVKDFYPDDLSQKVFRTVLDNTICHHFCTSDKQANCVVKTGKLTRDAVVEEARTRLKRTQVF